MSELHVSPGPGIPGGLIVPSGELLERFSRSSGPGGQGVNTTASRVQLSLDLAAAPAPPQRRATRPTRGSQRRRLAEKRRRGEIKNDRARPAADD